MPPIQSGHQKQATRTRACRRMSLNYTVPAERGRCECSAQSRVKTHLSSDSARFICHLGQTMAGQLYSPRKEGHYYENVKALILRHATACVMLALSLLISLGIRLRNQLSLNYFDKVLPSYFPVRFGVSKTSQVNCSDGLLHTI